MLAIASIFIGMLAAVVSWLQHPETLWKGIAISLMAVVAISCAGAFLPIPEILSVPLGLAMITALVALFAVLLTGLLRAWLPVRQLVAGVGIGMGLLAYGLLIWGWVAMAAS